jgi:hypothetical protein
VTQASWRIGVSDSIVVVAHLSSRAPRSRGGAAQPQTRSRGNEDIAHSLSAAQTQQAQSQKHSGRTAVAERGAERSRSSAVAAAQSQQRSRSSAGAAAQSQQRSRSSAVAAAQSQQSQKHSGRTAATVAQSQNVAQAGFHHIFLSFHQASGGQRHMAMPVGTMVLEYVLNAPTTKRAVVVSIWHTTGTRVPYQW